MEGEGGEEKKSNNTPCHFLPTPLVDVHCSALVFFYLSYVLYYTA